MGKTKANSSGVISGANVSRTLPPILPPNFISRKSILDEVKIDRAGITLVVAPDGYGKTSLVAEYVTSLDHPVIWLSFNDKDDYRSFNLNLIQSIRNVLPEFGKRHSNSQKLSVEDFLTQIFSELGSLNEHFIFVFDDGRKDIGDSAPMAKHYFNSVPQNVHSIIIRSVIPSEAFLDLKGLTNLTLIDKNLLKFSREEISIAAKIAGVSLDTPEIEKALMSLNGWPAGIQLTLNNISRGWKKTTKVDTEKFGSERSSGLVENLLSTLNLEERRMLESLAVLEEFTIEEAEVILGDDFSLSKLNKFSVDSLFLRYGADPLNNYSFNSLIRIGLIVNPTIEDKDLRAIHQRLSEHFAERGAYLKALEHAKFSRDQTGYRNLFRQGMRLLIATGRGKDLLSMADLVGDATQTGRLKRQTVEVMGLTADFQYLNAQSLIDEMLATSRGSEREDFIKKFTSAVSVYIDFATGLTEHLEENISIVLSSGPKELDLAAVDKLSILRVAAAKEIIYDNSNKLFDIQKMAEELVQVDSSAMALHFKSAIDACELLNVGEYKEAYVVANNVISQAEREGYVGIFGPLDMLYIKARCLLEFSQINESQEIFAQIKSLAESWNQFTWVYLAESFLARELAMAGNSASALDIVRSERERAISLSFRNGLDTYCDLTEVFIRYTMKDWERVGILLGRLPEFLLVQRIRAIYDFETGKKTANFVAADLPERTATQQIYKLMSQIDGNTVGEKAALELMTKALDIGARVGAKETFLRQNETILNLVIRIASEKPTVYLEDLASKITARLKFRSETLVGLSSPLTKREIEILRHLSTGNPISAIGKTLHISQNTMKTHLKNIYRKIGASGREEAVEKARSLYLL